MDPAGPSPLGLLPFADYRIAARSPLLSLNSNIILLPSGETNLFEARCLPFLLSVCSSCGRPQLDTHGVKVRMSGDFLVLAIGFDGNRGTQVLQWYMPFCNT